MRAERRTERFTLCAVALALACAGCADAPDAAAELSDQRRMLSEGYSMLHTDASHLALVRFALYAKVESDAVDEVVSAVAGFGGELETELERIAGAYPGVRIDLQPLPVIEKRKRRAIGGDKARYFMPVVGHSGREFERTLLIALMNGINHERHLCQVMEAEEPDAGLREFLIGCRKGYDALHARIETLLEREYYKDPSGPSRERPAAPSGS